MSRRLFCTRLSRAIVIFIIVGAALLLIDVHGVLAESDSGSISGRVTELDGTTPIPNCWVTACDQDGGIIGDTSTADDGTYTVENLPAGSYRVRFWDGSWEGSHVLEWYNDKPDLKSATPVNVTSSGNTPNINVSLEPGGSISGKVTELDGETPISDCWVAVYKEDGSDIGGNSTAKDGTYLVGGLPAGSYRVEFLDYLLHIGEWYDDKPDFESSTPVSVTAPGDTPNINASLTPGGNPSIWYLAEGTSDYGFDTYVTIANPNSTEVTTAVTYMTKEGPIPRETLKLPARSQTVINPRDDIGTTDFSTKIECKEGKAIAADRRMIWQGEGAPSQEGHCSIGVTAPARTWYLAEGSSKWGFETWLLIQNPNAKDAAVTITYMIEGKNPVAKTTMVPAHSRSTYSMEADIGQEDASIKVESSQPVISERSVYRNNRSGGHCSIGTTVPTTNFYLAEGTTGWGFTTYILIQNPYDRENTVTLTFMTPDYKEKTTPFTMPAYSRKTIKVNDILASEDFSTHVVGTSQLIAERAMYWENGTGSMACHDSIGVNLPHTCFYLPDGETQNGHETWTLVQNPNSLPVKVEISYLTPGGEGNVTFSDTIPANARKTYNMADRIPSGRAAVVVTSKTTGKKIIVERSMYWNSRSAGTDTIGGYSD